MPAIHRNLPFDSRILRTISKILLIRRKSKAIFGFVLPLELPDQSCPQLSLLIDMPTMQFVSMACKRQLWFLLNSVAIITRFGALRHVLKSTYSRDVSQSSLVFFKRKIPTLKSWHGNYRGIHSVHRVGAGEDEVGVYISFYEQQTEPPNMS